MRSSPRRAAALACAALPALAAQASAAVTLEPDRVIVEAPGARAVVTRTPYRLSIEDGSGRQVLAEVPNTAPLPLIEPPTVDPEAGGADNAPEATLYAPLTFTVGREQVQQWQAGTWVGNLFSAERSGIQYSARDVVAATAEGDGARLEVSTSDPTGRRLIVRITPHPNGGIRVGAEPTPSDGVAIVADSFATGPDEAFRGFGGRHNALDQRGTDFESFINQSNLDSSPFDPAAEAPPGSGGEKYLFPNGQHGAYHVQSQFVSSRPYGFLSLRNELTRWRMANDRPDAWQVATSGPGVHYVVFPGGPREAIRKLTATTGRQRVPPRWALEPQLDRLVQFPSQGAEQYRAEVLRDLRDIERFDVPIRAYRIEAWHYYDRAELRRVIARFREAGIRVLLYFRAFVGSDEIGTDDPGLLDEAIAKGYVATTATGDPYAFTSNFYAPAAMIDFTDPEAVAWWEGRIHDALDLGADGFMQDFGEQTFIDMHFANGETGATMHNRLPVLFHRATKRAIDSYRRTHPDQGDVFFYTRAGYSGEPGSVAYESATWPGDETNNWSRASGLPSQAPDMLNRGIAGAVGFGTDIGGYFDFGREKTPKELFLRWAEWAALTPVFRVHGTVLAGTHTPWSYDRATTRMFNRLARLHLAAAPLIRDLWREARRTGVPIARPLWLAVPGDARAAAQEQQWMLGRDVLVAPVVTEGARSREVYFPGRRSGGAYVSECWEHPETRERFRGPATRRVAAPLGRLPYFFRCGREPFEVGAAGAADDRSGSGRRGGRSPSLTG